MEPLLVALQSHGLLTAALLSLVGLLKYYITRDLNEIRTGVTKNAESYGTLNDYVKAVEERIEALLAVQDKEISMLKLETSLGTKNVTEKLETLTTTLEKYSQREESYQKEVSDFMGYVYRKLGNGEVFKGSR